MGTSTSRRSSSNPDRGSALWPLTVLAVVAVAGLAFWASRSPLFRLRDVEVTGATRLSQQDVVRLGGLHEDTNVLWLSTGAVEERLESSPWVAEATVTRELPRTVRVEIVERTATAAVRTAPEAWLLVAADGMVLEESALDPGLPTLGVPEGSLPPLEVGRVAPALARPARVAEAMSDWLVARVTVVRMRADGSLVIRTSLGTRVRYGPAEEFGTKAASLEAILRWSLREDTELAAVDLRSPRAPSAIPVAAVQAPAAEGTGTGTG